MQKFGREQLPMLFLLEIRRSGVDKGVIADKAGVGSATLRRFLNGSDTKAKDGTIKAIAEALGFAWNWVDSTVEVPDGSPVLQAIQPSSQRQQTAPKRKRKGMPPRRRKRAIHNRADTESGSALPSG